MNEKRKTATEALNNKSDIEDFIATGSSKPRHKKQVRRRLKKKKPLSPINPSFSRAMAKATIQKTIRFSPELIAQVEQWQAEQLSSGQLAMSFQQIQQEALREWLAAKAKQVNV